MNSCLNNYLSKIKEKPGLAFAVENTAKVVIPKLQNFAQYSNPAGLLLGQVQSGKTSHVFGIISAAADEEYKIFILLTSDISPLQTQTLNRSQSLLSGDFNVCGENDYLKLSTKKLKQPALIVLKKNSKVLEKWKKYLKNLDILKGQPLFIIDDEADSASLNTKINQKQQSSINKHLKEIRNLSAHTIYLQLTATPQSLFLQRSDSNFKPLFVHYFLPGEGYLGGDFFYSEPKPLCIKIIKENELSDIRETDAYIPDGLQRAFMSFLVAASDLALAGKTVCNFMIHPSVKKADHSDTANKIAEFMNSLLRADESEIRNGIKQSWEDLHDTKPDIKPFEEICCKAMELLDENNQKINIAVMNSDNELNKSYEDGFNIIVGGNTLGRGITFPALQTIYYCRKSKMPQADTYWQHCRMFGYDRDRGLMRIFIPQSMFKAFTDINYANLSMIKQIEKNPIEELRLIYPPTIKPTRRNVIDNHSLDVITGGVNYFPFYPSETNTKILDILLEGYQNESKVNIDFLVKIIENISLTSDEDWSKISFINCLKAWKASKEPGCTSGKLIVRRDRDISWGTGTLLSATDRNIASKEQSTPLLIMYRVNGQKNLGWNDVPLWIPNIKMPDGKFFYNVR